MTKATPDTHYTTLSCVCSEKQNKIYEIHFSSYQYISNVFQAVEQFHFAGGALKLIIDFKRSLIGILKPWDPLINPVLSKV